jgi:hypothetical protein
MNAYQNDLISEYQIGRGSALSRLSIEVVEDGSMLGLQEEFVASPLAIFLLILHSDIPRYCNLWLGEGLLVEWECEVPLPHNLLLQLQQGIVLLDCLLLTPCDFYLIFVFIILFF